MTREGLAGLEAIDLRVTAAALELSGERFTLCTIEDISDRKRLAVLTRLFFHDVLNTASGIQWGMDLLRRDTARAEDLVPQLAGLSRQLIEEIRAQRDLMVAESGDLTVEPGPVSVVSTLESLSALYAGQSLAEGRRIVAKDAWDGLILTDGRLLARVLGNAIKNALEATRAGDAVTLGCAEHGDEAVFSVHNPGAISEEVQQQIFQRSFSTKGEAGRGIGTYSMKLLGERYLGGQVGFTSGIAEGTTFRLVLPKVFPGTAAAERQTP